MHNLKRVWTYLVIVAVAMLAALNYELFVFPNSFAPSGLNGICTIIQYVSGISVGYMSLLINIPLAVLVFFKVSKPVAVRSMVYVVVFSVGLLILDKVAELMPGTEAGQRAPRIKAGILANKDQIKAQIEAAKKAQSK